MDTLKLHTLYVLSMTATHILFVIVVMRLWQLVRTYRICRDSWTLKTGMILVIVGTLVLAAVPIVESEVSPELMVWSAVRNLGLIILCWIIFAGIARFRPWDGKTERRTTGFTPMDTSHSKEP